jgi:hypothetical protein
VALDHFNRAIEVEGAGWLGFAFALPALSYLPRRRRSNAYA